MQGLSFIDNDSTYFNTHFSEKWTGYMTTTFFNLKGITMETALHETKKRLS
jgi:hypothetical protein